jgi:hypothetical protein
MDTQRKLLGDPHSLTLCGPAALSLYEVAKACFCELRASTIDINTVQVRLMHAVPGGLFRCRRRIRILFKMINPRGHGANSARFQQETLAWFRKSFPEDATLSDALVLFVCACRWWVEERGCRNVHRHSCPLTSSDFDKKLKSFGFLQGERDALVRVLRHTT